VGLVVRYVAAGRRRGSESWKSRTDEKGGRKGDRRRTEELRFSSGGQTARKGTEWLRTIACRCDDNWSRENCGDLPVFEKRSL